MADENDRDEPKYHVAISFLAADEPSAKALFDLLDESGLRVFFFPRAQEELAGTNGMESMRAPFLEALVNVVLFKAPWGETPWTRVESTAIQDRCLKDGWEPLFFVQMDQTSKFPKWLPTTHVRFSLENYPIEQLAGAIKMRVQQQGGSFSPLDAAGVAKRVKAQAEYYADRDALMSSESWIREVVHPSLRQTMEEVVRIASDINSTNGLQIASGANDKTCVMRSGFVSLRVYWRQPITNRVSDYESYKCQLEVSEFSGTVLLPMERGFVLHKPKFLKEHCFKVEVAQDRSLVWIEDGKIGQIPASQLADRIVKIFLDLVSRANRGEVERPPL